VRKLPIQFSLATTFLAVTAAAVLLCLIRIEGGFPYWTVLPAGIFIASHGAAHRESMDLAWGLSAIAWLVSLAEITRATIFCFDLLSHPPRGDEVGNSILRVYGSGILLPLFFSALIAMRAWSSSEAVKSSSWQWSAACAILALVNVSAAVVSIAILVKYAFP
jgi:hypothetical protein